MAGLRGQWMVAMVLALAAAAPAEPPAPNNPAGLTPATLADPTTLEMPAESAGLAPAGEFVVSGDAGRAPGADNAPGLDLAGVEGHAIGRGGASPGAGSGGQTSPRSSGASGWWRTAGALLLVVALILAMRWVLRRGGRLRPKPRSGQVIEILSRTPVSARHSLLLVRVGRRMLVVGAGESMTTLAQVDDPAQVAELMGSVEQARAHSLTNSFARALGQWRMDADASSAALETDADGAVSTPAAGAADRLRAMVEKVRGLGGAPGRRP